MRRTKEEAAITRRNLLDAALVVFSDKGYTATTLDDIAREAGITRGAIYWHFGNKADLFNTLVRERYTQAATVFHAAYVVGGTPLQLLRRQLVRWLGYSEENADFRAMLELTMFKTEAVPELADGMQEKRQGTRAALEYFATLIRQGIASGEIRPEVDPETAALAALGMVNGVTSLWLLDPAAFSLRDRAEAVIAVFIQGVAKV